VAALSASRIFAVETRQAERYDRIQYQRGDAFVFGQETSGLPEEVLSGIPPPRRVWLPMRPEMRSLNLSNAVAVMVFEAWRQIDFPGSA
jgi:tRNA (cytidine/uridine-2'-O-)-methyltransferase